MIITNCFDIAALLIQIFGTAVMFLNSPENKSDETFIYGAEQDKEIQKRKNKNLKVGFKILCAGFILQLFSLILKIFFQ